MRDICRRLLAPLRVPVVYGAAVGHTPRPMLTLPLGVRARLTAGGEGKLEILESAVLAPVKKMKNVESIYLIGIGGAAMAPLAGMLAERGYRVTGSDTGVYPPASTLLEKLGIRWKQGFSEQHLTPEPDLVVIGNAASRGNPEVEYVLDHKIPYRSLPETIRELFLPGHDSLVVSGTHGKTTTTAMLAWIFESAGRAPDFLVGGVAANFGKSYGLGGGREFIIEGDEYDSAFFDKGPKFLHYRPDDLIITSLEFDHADIYADLAAIELQFRRLVNLVPRRGPDRLLGRERYGPRSGGQGVLQGGNLRIQPPETTGSRAIWSFATKRCIFAWPPEEMRRARVRLPMTGRHNVLNAVAAIAIASGRGISREAIEHALATFRGVARRMQIAR